MSLLTLIDKYSIQFVIYAVYLVHSTGVLGLQTLKLAFGIIKRLHSNTVVLN